MSIVVALMGAGRVAEHHCKMLDDVEGIEIAAICDLREDRGKPLAEKVGVPWFTNCHEMLEGHPEIDIVTIATPSGMHFEHAIEIIEGHGKNIVVEKPTFMRPEEFRQAIAAADRKGVRIFPVFQNRYNKAVNRVRQGIASNELGDVRIATVRLRWCRPQPYYDRDPWRGTWSHDGGALTNQGVHYIDLLRHLGGEISQVNSVCATLDVDVEVEDTLIANVKFESGALGVIEVTTAARPDDFEASVSIVGSKGLTVISGIATNELVTYSPDSAACQDASEHFPIVYGFGHRGMYRDIIKALKGQGDYPVSYEDAMKSLILLHSLYRSDEEGGWIDVNESSSSERLGRPNEEVSKLYRTPSWTNGDSTYPVNN